MSFRSLSLVSVLAFALILPLVSGCSGDARNGSEGSAGASSEAASAMTGGSGSPAPGAAGSQDGAGSPPSVFSGQVVETMNASNYTYVRLEHAGQSVWAAGPVTPVNVGDALAVSLAMPMPDFESETLGRTFETLYFVNTFQRVGGGSSPADAHGGVSDPHAGLTADPHAGTSRDPHAGPAADPGAGSASDPHAGLPGREAADPHGNLSAPTDLGLDGIEKPDGGYTIAEVYDRKMALAGQSIALRGRVVRYNAGILGRNWLHLQDGSGDSRAGTHDIVVTSTATAKIGDLVTVRGLLSTDKDLGAGYRYAVLVEDAEIAQEASLR